MPRLQRKNLSAPDEVRQFADGHIDLLNLDETAVGHLVFRPGWRWSRDVGPVAGTTWCQNRHVGYVLTGRLRVGMEDGTELEIGPGDAYEIPPGHDMWVVGEDPWDSVEFASSRVFGVDPHATDERVLATILFTDIVDSTATLGRIGDRAWRQLLLEHNQRIRGVIDAYRGREVVTTGDGFLALFDGAARAVRCALAAGPAVADLGITIRAGLHTGEVAMTGGQASGLAIHAAARISAICTSNEVLVSGTTRDLLDGSGLAFEDRGRHELKGFEGARPVFAVLRPRPEPASAWHTAAMPIDQAVQHIEEARTRLHAIRGRVEAGDPWPLAERFDHAPEASWGPPEILAHCLEMVDYWRTELDRVALATGEEPTPFGRVATDLPRLAAIGRDRQLSTAELYDRLDGAIDRIVAQWSVWTADQRTRLGVHPSGDTLDIPSSLDRFIGGHLAAHATQLETILGDAGSPAPD